MMNIGGTPFEFAGLLLMVIPILTLLFYGLVIYFLVSVILFMKNKTRNDEQLLRKLDQLVEFRQRENENHDEDAK